jgi:urease accessory protein
MLSAMTVEEVGAASVPHGGPSDSRECPMGARSDRELQRAQGAVRLVLAGSEHGTRIVDVYQQSPLRVLFPRVRGGAPEEAVLVNTAGGIAGGDRLESAVTVMANACATATSQAAERVYRALDEPALVTTRLKVDATSRLAWLPQETIVFDRARLRRSTEIELCSGAELLALEWLVLGRAAHGEEMVTGEITDRWRVKRDGRLVWADSFHVNDEVLPRLRSRALLADFKSIATLIYCGPDCQHHLDSMREQRASLKCRCAATVVSGLLIARFAASASVDLKESLRAALVQFGKSHRSSSFGPPKMWSV